jgi:DNA-binding response OmpR family regulator
MELKQVKIASFLILLTWLLGSYSYAQNDDNDKHIEVSLRMIGHQVLLSYNDSISRVLPIIKENDRYKISFESEFEFIPEELVATIDRVVKETNLATQYIVEVEQCENREVVYSFKMNEVDKSDIVPCQSRTQTQSCYNLYFTLIEPIKLDETNNLLSYIGVLFLFILVSSFLFFAWKRKNRNSNDPNLIPLGAYHFDKRNTELLIEHQRIELTSKEADLLLLLYNTANTTVEREVILNTVWGDEGNYVGRTLDVFISKLRKKLEFDSKLKIVNIRGVGYKLVMDV